MEVIDFQARREQIEMEFLRLDNLKRQAELRVAELSQQIAKLQGQHELLSEFLTHLQSAKDGQQQTTTLTTAEVKR
jgi:hypothetical protein